MLDTLDGEWLRLPLAVMQDVGPAVQTLAGVLKVTNKETYVPVERIAKAARLPIKTVRKHLVTLHERGWIVNHGRQRTRKGHLRRTATITVTAKTQKAGPYAILPWWACCRNLPRRSSRQRGMLPWCAKAILALVVSRLVGIKEGVARASGTDSDDPDLVASLDDHEERFRFSLKYFMAQTGLWRDAVVRAKGLLHKAGIVTCSESEYCDEADLLLPNYDFRAVVTPAAGHPGHVYVTFE